MEDSSTLEHKPFERAPTPYPRKVSDPLAKSNQHPNLSVIHESDTNQLPVVNIPNNPEIINTNRVPARPRGGPVFGRKDCISPLNLPPATNRNEMFGQKRRSSVERRNPIDHHETVLDDGDVSDYDELNETDWIEQGNSEFFLILKQILAEENSLVND